MRTLLPLHAAARPAGLHAQQAIPLDCGQPADAVPLSTSAVRANLTFHGDRVRPSTFVSCYKDDVRVSARSQVQVVDQYRPGPITPRTATTATTTGDTPIDLAGAGPGIRSPVGSALTRCSSPTAQPDLSGTVLVTWRGSTALAAPASTLSCGRSTRRRFSLRSANRFRSRGQMDTLPVPGAAGDLISFRLLRVAVSGGLDTGTGFFLAIYGPDGHMSISLRALPTAPPSRAGLAVCRIAQIYAHYEGRLLSPARLPWWSSNPAVREAASTTSPPSNSTADAEALR